MKNSKAIFLIVLGTFLMATGFAFAENTSLAQAGNPSLWKSDGPAATVLPQLSIDTYYQSATAAMTPPTPTPPVVTPPVPNPTPTPVVKPPTIGEKISGFISDNKKILITSVLVGFLAFLIIGTGGAALLAGGAAFAFFSFNKKF